MAGVQYMVSTLVTVKAEYGCVLIQLHPLKAAKVRLNIVKWDSLAYGGLFLSLFHFFLKVVFNCLKTKQSFVK